MYTYDKIIDISIQYIKTIYLVELLNKTQPFTFINGMVFNFAIV